MSFNAPQKLGDAPRPPIPQRSASRPNMVPTSPLPPAPIASPGYPALYTPNRIPQPQSQPLSPELPPPPPPPSQISPLNLFTPPTTSYIPSIPSPLSHQYPPSNQQHNITSTSVQPQNPLPATTNLPPAIPPVPASTAQPISNHQQTHFFSDDREIEDDEEPDTLEYDTTSFKLTQGQRPIDRKATYLANSNPPGSGGAISIADSSFFNHPPTTASTSLQVHQSPSQPPQQPQQPQTSTQITIPPYTIPSHPIEFEVVNLGQIHNRKPYGTVGIRSELYPNSPDHSKILNLIRTRSMSLYNAVYKINKTFTNIPTPNPNIYHKLVSQSQMITERLDRFNDRKFQEKDSKYEQEKLQQQREQQQQAAQAIPISQALKTYPDILAACLDSPDLANTIVMLLNSIYDLQRAHTFDFDTATTIEAAYAYHHQKLENLQQQEEESRRKAIILTKDYLSIKSKEDHKKVEKSAMMAYNAIRTYEHDRKESCFQIIHTDLASTGTIIKPLKVRLQSYYDYYKKGYELMQPFEPLLRDLGTRCNNDDEHVNAQLYTLAHDQDVLDKQVKQYLTKLNLLETANGFSMSGPGSSGGPGGFSNGQYTPSENPPSTGIRDLDNRKINREIGTTKRGFLYTPPPTASRVWVELKDKVLRVSEETSTAATGSRSAHDGKSSGFQNLLDKVTSEAKSSSQSLSNSNPGNQNQTSSSNMNNSMSSSSLESSQTPSSQTSYKVIFETQTMLLTAKALRDSKFRYVFQVIGPTGNCTLQAESEVILNEWLDVIQNAVGDDLKLDGDNNKQSSNSANSHGPNSHKLNHLHKRRSISAAQSANQHASSGHHNGSSNSPYNPNEVLERLQSGPGNKFCCDCGSPNPDWISINLGILICLDCSGAHRQLGTSISKVRSIMMDKLDSHIITYCCGLGNSLVNNIFLEFHQHDIQQAQLSGSKPDPALSINAASPRNEKFEHIKSKYQDRRWVLQDILLTSISHRVLSPQQIEERHLRLTTLLYNGVRQDSMSNVYRACISGADPTRCMASENVAPLFESVLYNCPTFLTCMFQFTEQINFKEDRGWNCLHYAAYVNSLEMCEIALSMCGSDLAVAIDGQGNTPRQVAEHFNSDEPEFQQDLPALLSLLTNAELKYQQKLAKNY